VLLIGLMGTGKTTVGVELARRLDCPYLDNDVLLQEHTGLSLRAVFDARGTDELHQREWEVFKNLLQRPGPWVASAAASVITEERVVAALQGVGVFVVWLRARVDTLVARVGGARDRPLLDDDAWSTFTRMVEERSPLYRRVSSMIVDVDELSPAQVAESIEAGLTAKLRADS
jgi:shikimate kinase